MCKTKSRTDAIDPPKSVSRPSSASRNRSSPSSSFTAATSSGAGTGSSLLSSSSKASASASSLSSLRFSLPDNPLVYSPSEISAATNSFQSRRLSSSSSSWRCSLRGRDVAVFQRRIRRSPDLHRLLSSLCKSHHSSIADLVGASVSGDHIYLVYDFVPGASLSDCLRNPNNPSYTVLSTWLSRMQVVTDLADGLLYIHHHSGLGLRLIHNHFKSSSVIVSDPSLQAKICHFGAAQLTGELPDHQIRQIGEIQEIGADQDRSSSSSSGKLVRSGSGGMKLQGTRGYMPPEFLTAGMVSQKSDVYAFGVVVLELLSGDEPLRYRFDKNGGGDYRRISLVESAAEVIEAGGGLRRWIDGRLRDSFPVDTAEKMTRVALECVHVDPEKRPDMERLAAMASKLYLDSKSWAETMRIPTDFTVSMAPR